MTSLDELDEKVNQLIELMTVAAHRYSELFDVVDRTAQLAARLAAVKCGDFKMTDVSSDPKDIYDAIIHGPSSTDTT